MKPADAAVTHVIHSGGFYGAERMLVDHCLATQQYVKNTVVLITPPEDLLKRFSGYGVDCVSCDSLSHFIRMTKNTSAIVNAHNFKAQIYAWIAAKRNKLPLIFTQHGFTPRSIKQYIYMWSSILLCKTPTVRNVVCVANSIAGLHRKFYIAEKKIHVIANGLPDKTWLAREHTSTKIGFIGRLSEEKGPDLFLQTVIPVLKKKQNVQAVLLGDGPQYSVLEAEIERHGLSAQIHLLGYQENVNRWLAELSVLVISSRTEGTPMVLLEAMQAGVPVVAFSVGGIPDVIEHAKEGLLAQALNTQELSICVEKILENSELAKELSDNAKKRQAIHYDLANNAKHWFAVYTSTQGSLAP